MLFRATVLLAGVSWYMVASREELMIRHVELGGAVSAVRVVSIDTTAGSTNGNPPRVRIAVEESFAGGLETKELDAVWTPYPYDSHGDGAGVSDEFVREWKAKPLTPPAVGWRGIVGIQKDAAGVFTISPHLRDELREGLRAETLAIVKKAKPGKRAPPPPPAPPRK